jgi:hypothetical protein
MRENLLNLSTTPRSAVLIVKKDPSSEPSTTNANTTIKTRMIIAVGFSTTTSPRAQKFSFQKRSKTSFTDVAP